MFQSEQLQEKWAPLLNYEGLDEIKAPHRKAVTAVLLENQEKFLREEQHFNSGINLMEAVPTNSANAAGAAGGGVGGGGGVTKVLNKVIKDPVEGVMNTVADPAGTIAGGPKGTLGDITDKLYGGTTQDLIEGAQGKTEEEAVATPVLSAEEVDPQAALTAQNQKRKQEQGRGAANLTAGQSATMLTS